jgi:hypothetical protein
MFLKSLAHRLSETHKVIRIVDPVPARRNPPVPANGPRKPGPNPGG